MVQRKQTPNLSSLFEQRAREIDAERRSAPNDGPALRMGPPQLVDLSTILAEIAATPAAMAVVDSEKEDSPVESLLLRGEELLAVSGLVNPHDLIPPETSSEIRESVHSSLLLECTTETHQDKVRWLHLKEPRNAVLRRLNEEGRLQKLLGEPLPPTDPYGDMLRALLQQGDTIPLESMATEALKNLELAIEATNDTGLPHPDRDRVRRLIRREEFLSEYDVLLSRGFFGRQKELAELNNFLSSPHEAGRWSSLVMTGAGGAGKSTLLAKFSRDVVKEKSATVVILDFDSPGVDARDLYWMEHEISRQVGYQFSPDAAEYLSMRRSEERRHRGVYVDAVSQSSAEGFEEVRSSRSILWSVNEVLEREAPQRPVLLVMDTYEQIEDQDLSSKIFEWLYEIASALAAPLKVIFSGRLYDDNLTQLRQHSKTDVLTVDELAPQDAEELLLRNGVTEAIARRLVWSNVLPLRPLELTLLARMTTDLDKTIEELEEELLEGGESAKELFAGLVYRRVLRRLGDPVAQQLAYPGLVLRYVTVDLIRNVLAPALGLRAFDEAEAAKALDALASCSWLVRRENDKVWHRSDLRRSTLKAMIAAEPESARKISEAAVHFFQKQSDDSSRAEAVYHRLMLMRDPSDGEAFELAELKKANGFIKANVADLPSMAQTLLKFAVEDKVPATEVECLPKRYLEKGYRAAGEELVQTRLFGKALKLYNRKHGESVRSEYFALEEWEVETLFATASWDRMTFAGDYKEALSRFTFYEVVRAMYHAQTISIDPQDIGEIDKLLKLIADQKDLGLLMSDSTVSEHEILRYMVVNLMYIAQRGKEWAADLFAQSDHRRVARSEQISPVTTRRLMLLERAFFNEPCEVPFTINTLRLDSGWLTAFQEIFARPGGAWERVQTLATDTQRILNEPPPPGNLRTVLSFIQSVSKEQGVRRGSEIVIDKDVSGETAWDYLRGPSPEFRDPCRFALLDAFPDRSSHRKLGEIFASLISVDATDLKPDVFADTVAADPEAALQVYVEFVDRIWMLGDLMNEARKWAASPKLEQVSDAFNRWNDALRATIDKGFLLNPSDSRIERQRGAAYE